MVPREGSPALYDEMLQTCRENGDAPPRVEHALRPVEGLLAGCDAVSLGAARVVDARPGLAWRPLAGAPLSWRTSVVWRAGTMTAPKRSAARIASAALRRWEEW